MKEKVNVTGVPETMVQTLYARAKETKKQKKQSTKTFTYTIIKPKGVFILCGINTSIYR